MSIVSTTLEIWPEKAKNILKSKKVNIKKLERKFKKIYFPWSKSYDRERVYYSLRIQQRPLIIVKVQNINEIEEILNYSYLKKLNIRVCGGRHSTQLLSPDVLIDISDLNSIKYNDKQLIVQSGATQGQANDYIFNKNKSNYYSHFGHFTYGKSSEFPGGSAQSVGVAGISFVGGIGVLRRMYGLTIDSINSFNITLPPTITTLAKTITVNNSDNKYSDLFWALCGGGANNFGIVSNITYKLFEVNDVIEYTIEWDFSQAKNVINLWSSIAISRPNEFTEEIDLYCTNGKLGINLSGFYVVPKLQSDADAINIIQNSVKYLGGKLTINPSVQYSVLYNQMVKNRVYHNFSILQGVFTNIIDIDTIIDSVKGNLKINGNFVVGIELLGGKITEGNIGSFGFRKSNFFINVNSNWDNLIDTQECETYLNCFTKKLLNRCNGVYLGFPIAFTDINYTNKIYYDNSYEKLKFIKTKYDPENVLSYSGTL